MKLKLFVICILSLFVTATVSAQSYTFRVIGSKGNNTVDGKPLKVGMTLTDNQSIMIASNGSYLGLMHKTGKTLELQNKGSHKVKDLVSKIKGSGNLNSRYAKFVANELSQDGGPSAAKARSRHMKKTGSVERDVSKIKTMLPKNSDIYGSTAAIKWFLKENKEISEADIKEYKVYVLDMEEEVLHTQVTSETMALIDISDEKFTDAEQLIFKIVAIKQDGSALEGIEELDGKMLQVLDEESKGEVESEVKEVVKGQEGALAKLIEAQYYDEHDLISDAIRTYEQVLELSNDAPMYQGLYEAFLIRNNISKEDLSVEDKEGE